MTDDSNPVDFTVAQTNAVLVPVFLPLPDGQFALTVETHGSGLVRGRTRKPSNLYPAASNVFLRAVPGAGQSFLGWSFDGSGAGSSGLITPIIRWPKSNRF